MLEHNLVKAFQVICGSACFLLLIAAIVTGWVHPVPITIGLVLSLAGFIGSAMHRYELWTRFKAEPPDQSVMHVDSDVHADEADTVPIYPLPPIQPSEESEELNEEKTCEPESEPCKSEAVPCMPEGFPSDLEDELIGKASEEMKDIQQHDTEKATSAQPQKSHAEDGLVSLAKVIISNTKLSRGTSLMLLVGILIFLFVLAYVKIPFGEKNVSLSSKDISWGFWIVVTNLFMVSWLFVLPEVIRRFRDALRKWE